MQMIKESCRKLPGAQESNSMSKGDLVMSSDRRHVSDLNPKSSHIGSQDGNDKGIQAGKASAKIQVDECSSNDPSKLRSESEVILANNNSQKKMVRMFTRKSSKSSIPASELINPTNLSISQIELTQMDFEGEFRDAINKHRHQASTRLRWPHRQVDNRICLSKPDDEFGLPPLRNKGQVLSRHHRSTLQHSLANDAPHEPTGNISTKAKIKNRLLRRSYLAQRKDYALMKSEHKR